MERHSPRAASTPATSSEVEQTIPQAFKAQVEIAPDRIAVITRTCALSYASLDVWSDAVARQLLEHLGNVHEPVPFLMPQGPLAIATTLGILKAGKFYVPLDLSWGLERVGDLVRELGGRVLLTNAEIAPMLRGLGKSVVALSPDPPNAAVSPVHIETSPDQPAYIYFTSGSTGPPKGVMDCHRNVLHNVMRYTRALHVVPGDRLSLLQSCGFSGAISSMFTALLNGATSCPIDLGTETPARLARWLSDVSVTIYHSVPSLFRSVVSAGEIFPRVRVVRLEGDRASRLDLDLFRRHFTAPSVLAIGLGTTETGLVSQYFFNHDCPIPDDGVPIGYPVTDIWFEIRDDAGRPAPQGMAGEIVVHSRFLALGYWNDASATARAFEPAVGTAERAYKTGDVGRIAEDGGLEYLGRADGRMRIRGQWIEPVAIETELCAIPGVRDAVVVVQNSENAEPLLVAYYVSSQQPDASVSDLRHALARRLPPYMIPTRFVALQELPLNANGKVDRIALPKPSPLRPRTGASWTPPANLVQLRICQIWEELLCVNPVGIRDDFFDLGGDSLLALQMLDRIDSALGCSLPVSSLLVDGGASIEHLARLVVTGSSEMAAPIVPIRREGNRLPFFFLHGDYISGGIYCRELVRYLHPDRPFYAIPPCGLDGQPVPLGYELMAPRHLEHLRKVQPRGPYILGGECNGGLVAYEIARLLEAQGEHVSLLMLLSASAQNVRFAPQWAWLGVLATVMGLSRVKQDYLRRRVGDFTRNHHGTSAITLLRHLCRKFPHVAVEFGTLLKKRDDVARSSMDPGRFGPQGDRDRLRATYQEIDRSYLPGRFGGSVTLIKGREETPDIASELAFWRTIAADVETIEVPGNTVTKLTAHVGALGRVMDQILERTLNECVISERRDVTIY